MKHIILIYRNQARGLATGNSEQVWYCFYPPYVWRINLCELCAPSASLRACPEHAKWFDKLTMSINETNSSALSSLPNGNPEPVEGRAFCYLWFDKLTTLSLSNGLEMLIKSSTVAAESEIMD